jgi:signal transduction histidine kinase
MADAAGLRILVVEDDPDTRTNLRDILELDGCEVVAVGTAAEALNRSDWDTYAAILLDWRLPDARGETLLPQLRKRAPDAAVIVSTGVGGLEGAVMALRHGATDYITKPVDGELLRASVRRVAEQRRLRREKAQAEARLLQAERLAAIGKAMTGLAHESRNALQRGQANLELLALLVQDRPEALDLVKRLQRVQADLHHLYEEVRQYAAPLNLTPEPHDLGELIQEAWDQLAPQHGSRDAAIEILAEGTKFRCPVDPFQMLQAFRNILENSLAAAPDPVRITASVSSTRLDERDALCVCLRDNGPGIPADRAQSVFEEFFTTKTRGTGLGLAIVKRIIEAHGGRVRVNQDYTAGAELIVTLPRE